MRKLLFALLLIPTAAYAQIKMTAHAFGQQIGTATYNHKVAANGNHIQNLSIKLDLKGVTGELAATSEQSKTGKAIREFYRKVLSGEPSEEITKTYVAGGVVVKKSLNGNITTQTVPYPKNAKLVAVSDLWFVKVKPKKGAVDSSHDLDEDTLKWRLNKVKYVGDERLVVAGKVYPRAHKITHSDGALWLDDRGFPIRIRLVDATMTMVLDRAK